MQTPWGTPVLETSAHPQRAVDIADLLDRRVIPPEDRPRAPDPQSHYKSGVTGAVSALKGLDKQL